MYVCIIIIINNISCKIMTNKNKHYGYSWTYIGPCYYTAAAAATVAAAAATTTEATLIQAKARSTFLTLSPLFLVSAGISFMTCRGSQA